MAKVEIIQAYAPNLSSRIQLHVIQHIDDLNHISLRETTPPPFLKTGPTKYVGGHREPIERS